MEVTAAAERNVLRAPERQDARNLRGEMIDALLSGQVSERLPVPGWRDAYGSQGTTATVEEIVWDELDGDVEAFHDLLQIVALAAGGAMTPELHLRASAWIAKRAAFYNKTHGGLL